MADVPHFVGVASAEMDGDFCIMRLAGSDRKAYKLALTDAAVRGIVQSLQRLMPLLPNAERETLQVVRSQSLLRPDARKAILLETQVATLAFELSEDMIAILQRQLADLQAVQKSTTSH